MGTRLVILLLLVPVVVSLDAFGETKLSNEGEKAVVRADEEDELGVGLWGVDVDVFEEVALGESLRIQEREGEKLSERLEEKRMES